MNIIKHILSKKQNSEHFISIIVYATFIENENSSKFKTKCNTKFKTNSSFCVDLTVLGGAGHFDTLVESMRMCIIVRVL